MTLKRTAAAIGLTLTGGIGLLVAQSVLQTTARAADAPGVSAKQLEVIPLASGFVIVDRVSGSFRCGFAELDKSKAVAPVTVYLSGERR